MENTENESSQFMGVACHIHICDPSPDSIERNGYLSNIVFDLTKWVYWSIVADTLILQERKITCRPIRRPVDIIWVNRRERRELKDLDLTVTKLVTAGDLKGLKLYEDSWHDSRVQYARAVMGFLNELNDEWPIILYFV